MDDAPGVDVVEVPGAPDDPPTEIMACLTVGGCTAELGCPEQTATESIEDATAEDRTAESATAGDLAAEADTAAIVIAEAVSLQHVWPLTAEVGPWRPASRVERPALNSISLAHEVSRAGVRPVGRANRWWHCAVRFVQRVLGVGEAARRRTRDEHAYRVRHPLTGDHRIAVVSLKGGVGKTTITVALGSVLASLRGDRVIAVDASPDFGTLASRGPHVDCAGVMGLLAGGAMDKYSDVGGFTSQTSSRLELLASQRDPAASEPFSADGYSHLIDVLRRFYNIVLTDCGTGLAHPVMKSVLDETDVVVIVTSPAMDGATGAATALDWLSCNGYGYLAETAVVVVDVARPGITPMDADRLAAFFRSRARAAHVIPYDRHLAEGGEIALHLLATATRDRVLELAASLASAFPTDGSQRRRRTSAIGARSALHVPRFDRRATDSGRYST